MKLVTDATLRPLPAPPEVVLPEDDLDQQVVGTALEYLVSRVVGQKDGLAVEYDLGDYRGQGWFTLWMTLRQRVDPQDPTDPLNAPVLEVELKVALAPPQRELPAFSALWVLDRAEVRMQTCPELEVRLPRALAAGRLAGGKRQRPADGVELRWTTQEPRR